MTNCTTHFHACDCREAMFAEMVEVAKDLMGPLERAASELASNGFVLDEFAQASFDRARALIARATDQGEMK